MAEADLEAGAPKGGLPDLDEPAVPGRNLGNYGQTEPAAPRVPIAGFVEPNEPLEYAPAFRFGYTRPIVVDGDHYFLGALDQRQRNRASGMAGCIVDEISNQLAKLSGIPIHSSRRHSLGLDAQIGRCSQSVDLLQQNVVEIDGFVPPLQCPLIHLGQQKEVVHKSLQPQCLREDNFNELI